MGIKYGPNLSLALRLSSLFWMVKGLGPSILDDSDPRLVYSNSGPSWLAVGEYNSGILVGDYSNLTSLRPYKDTWHETKGDGASVALTFTGTRVMLNVTICGTIYDTVVDLFVDGKNKGRYQHYSAGPVTLHDRERCDPQFQVAIADFDGLSPTQHIFKAVSVGDVLFAVDSISFEASAAVPASSSPVTTSPLSVGTTAHASTGATPSSSSTASSLSGSTSTSSSTSSTVDSQPVGSSMDVSAADSRIVYAPPGAWKQYSDARRATSCLDGTTSSSTVNSSLTYNFTGPAVQVYTISSTNGGNLSITIDGQARGVSSSYDASADPSTCPSRPLYSTVNLPDTQHTLVLTVQDRPSGSTQDTVQFVGFRTPSPTTTSSPSGSGSVLNLAPIIGGVVGGLSGLILLVLLVIWWMRRQYRIEEADLLSKMPGPLRSSFSSLSKAQRGLTRNDQVHRVAGPSHALRSSFVAQRGRSNVSYDAAPLSLPPPPHHTVDNDDDVDDEDDGHERLTYYTLPSYHENVMQTAAARNLSEADVNAISRRLQEVMRTQMVQAGRDPNELVGMIPPRELIDHLVEEQLRPRTE